MATLAACALLATGCSGSKSSTAKPADPLDLLRQAKAAIDATSGVHFVLTASQVPSGLQGVTAGEGDAVHPDGFQGSLKVTGAGLSGTVKVIAVAHVVYAKLPLLPGYHQIDPTSYGFGDPGQFIDATNGLPSLLVAPTTASYDGQARIDGTVLDRVKAVLPGPPVAGLLGSADSKAPVQAEIGIDPASHQIRSVVLTGPFFSATQNSTFTLTLSKYGENVTVRAPARPRQPRRALTLACLAVLLAAADTYVVVLALPNIMSSVGLTTDQLSKATPIVSGFLLSYVALLPLVGRLSDLYGRRPVLIGCLVGFAAGSAVTAGAHSLAAIVTGRFLQGLGGGGLIPVTLALVADQWPPDRRSLPLGMVGAVQEIGSLLGPLYGAALVAVGGWRSIFWVNLVAGLALAAAIGPGERRGHRDQEGHEGHEGHEVHEGHEGHSTSAFRRDPTGWALLVLTCAAGLLTLSRPALLTDSVRYGGVYVPLASGHGWSALTEPLALGTLGAAVLLVARLLIAPAPIVALRRLPTVLHSADFPGALLFAGMLGCVIVMFSAADPTRQALASGWPWLTAGAGVLALSLVWRERVAAAPLFDWQALGDPIALGALLTSLAVGAGLIVALVDVPLFARATSFPDSQLDAALVLVRFLVGVPLGALVGGAVCERLGYRATAAGGMSLATACFVAMANWGTGALPTHGVATSDVVLLGCGLGFGLAIAPVNAAALRAVPSRVHGLVSALVVLTRTVGMLVGISALTALGLRAFSRSLAQLGTPDRVCPATPTDCPVYDHAARVALLHELHVIFAGAAGCTAAAALAAGLTLRRAVAPSS